MVYNHYFCLHARNKCNITKSISLWSISEKPYLTNKYYADRL